jgi:O-antigen/teichoic acid export membrane protein
MAQRTLSKRALYYMAAQMGANLVGSVTAMVLARVFSKDEMGDYQQLWMLYTLFSGILIMGLPQSLTYFYAVVEDRQKAASVYFVAGLLFVMGLVLGLATYIAAPYAGTYFKNPNLTALVRNFFLFYAFTMGGSYLRRLSVVTDCYVFLMFWLPFDRVLMLLSFAVPVAILHYDLAGAVRVAVWIAGVKFLITTAYTIYVIPPQTFSWAKGLARQMLYFSIPLGLTAGVAQISASIDRLVIGRYMDRGFYAVFSLGATPIPFVPEIAESAMTVLIPVLAKLYIDKNNLQFALLWQESVRKTAIFILGTFAFVEFFALPITVALYGDKYAESATYFRICQFGLLFRVTMYGAVLQALGKTRQMLYVMLVVVGFKPFVSVGMFKLFNVLWPGSGPVGPPISSVIISFLSAVYYTVFARRQLGVSYRVIWPWAAYFRILGSAVAAALLAAAVLFIPGNTLVSALKGPLAFLAAKPSIVAVMRAALGGAVFVPIYVLLLHFTRALKPKDWELLRDMTYGRLLGQKPKVAVPEEAAAD